MKPKINVAIEAIAITAPGLPNWATAAPILTGAKNYQPEPLPKFKPTLLPANEARRATSLIRLAFKAAEEALANWQNDGETAENSDIIKDPASLAAVFASSGGDTDIIDKLCTTNATNPKMISPTSFHNSVHNSAAGYWSIATGSMHASNSLSAHDASFAAGLLESYLMLQHDDAPVLLVAYDTAVKPPLFEKRSIGESFACALLLKPVDPSKTAISPTITIELTPSQKSHNEQSSFLEDLPELEALRKENPAARSLPLLQALAKKSDDAITLPATNGSQLIVTLKH